MRGGVEGRVEQEKGTKTAMQKEKRLYLKKTINKKKENMQNCHKNGPMVEVRVQNSFLNSASSMNEC